MNLLHFTSHRKLRGISQFGLTVGDVPTDIRRNRGRCGVWLTSSPAPVGHGLNGNPIDKQAIRLAVELPDNAPLLFRRTDWKREAWRKNLLKKVAKAARSYPRSRMITLENRGTDSYHRQE